MRDNPTLVLIRRLAAVASVWLTPLQIGCDTTADSRTCPGCTIDIAHAATIGDSTDAGSLPGRPLGVYETAPETFVVNVLDGFPVIVRLRGSSVVPIGPSGEGPGEFRSPTVVAALPADSVLVSEVFTFTVLLTDGTVGRQIRSRQPLEEITVVRWPTNVWGASRSYDAPAGTNRHVVVRYDFSTDSVVSLDTVMRSPPAGGSDFANELWRAGRPGSDGLWMARYNAYRLIRFNALGEARDTLVRTLDWFPGGEPDRMAGPDRPTSPHMLANWMEGDSLLWTVVEQPREDTRAVWADFPPPTGGVGEVRVSALPAPHRLSRSVIEVFDMDTKALLASHVFDGYVISVLAGNRVASYTETDAGVPILNVHAVSLSRR